MSTFFGDGVSLGFLERAQYTLPRSIFPSKVWLNPKNPPPRLELLCDNCHNPLSFIAQIYCPLDDLQQAFHRTLFLFCCKNGSCYFYPGSIKVVRAQLPQVNEFYLVETEMYPEEEKGEEKSRSEVDWVPESCNHDLAPLCIVCGCLAPKKCAKCKLASYCGRNHQKVHWDAIHRDLCSNPDPHADLIFTRKVMFPQYEIIFEEEILPDRGELTEAELANVKFVGPDEMGIDVSEIENLNEVEDAEDVDLVFDEFQKRMQGNSGQCVRYERCGEPLWVSALGQVENVPTCEHCGARRVFEFQVLPQALHFLSVDGWDGPRMCSMDWGTLVIYTCSDSCTVDMGYANEFVWFQKSPASL